MSRAAGTGGPVWVWPTVVAFVVATLVGHAALGALALVLVNADAAQRAVTARAAETPAPETPTPDDVPRSTGPTSIPVVPKGPLVIPASCVRSASPRTTASIPRGDRFGAAMRDLGAGARLVRLYQVHRGGLIPIDGVASVRACDAALWRVIVTLAPPQTLALVDELLVFDADLSARSSVAGEVVPDASHDGFRLALSLNGLKDPREIGFLLAHELAHVVTLNGSEIVGSSSADCSRVVDLGDVCLRKTSVLNGYVRATWSTTMTARWARTVGTAPRSRRVAAAEAFVRRYSGSFVTPYAGYSQAEDFAETFALWCAVDAKHPYRRLVSDTAHPGVRAKVAWIQAHAGLRTGFVPRCSRLRTLTVR